MTNDSGHYETTDEELTEADLSEFSRLRGRTWIAAAPYLAAAVVCWVVATFTQYKVLYVFQNGSADGPQSSMLRSTILQTLTQILIYAGLALFTLGILVAVLRQHERWRRDLDMSLDDASDSDGIMVTETVSPPPDATPPDATPPYARSVWDAPTEVQER